MKPRLKVDSVDRTATAVCARVRPTIAVDQATQHGGIKSSPIAVEVQGDGQTALVTKDAYDKKAFKFDHAFGSTCSNKELYRVAFQNIVSSVITKGFNGSVIAYGQTGAGGKNSRDFFPRSELISL